ncbi:glutamate transport system permease protein [Stackebrandtia albiflava]|uniref:Glutamate transport system permease protein n=1 Tax=Stackebrandtia albiflava TaxID=406432 RepID=A0A562VBS2_9ACTN|nr:amino acid ABC transporter permease [Stackebrandtia albiflava]TWJ15310.1 glutamate transport system permease protein [Stackebrandtia albiflava]
MFDNLAQIAAALGSGLWVTVWVTAVSFFFALVIGGVLATMHVSPAPPARWFATAYTGLFKNIPLLAVLFIMYFGLPKIGIALPNWQWAIIGLSTYTAAFVGETLRSGINSINLGQAEAARSIGLTFGQSLRNVILPQAFRTVIPPLGSLLTALVKNSSLVLAIGVTETSAMAQRLINDTDVHYNLWTVIIGVALCYLIVNLPISYFIRRAERRAEFAR